MNDTAYVVYDKYAVVFRCAHPVSYIGGTVPMLKSIEVVSC